jgi:RecA-family ATPase
VLGASGVGKSFVIVDMGLSIATGKEWQGHKTKQGAVYYVCGEGKSGIKKRCLAWAIKNDVQLANTPFIVSDSALVLPNKDSIELLHTEIKNSGHIPTLIIFDTLARCLEGDENQAKDIGAFIQSVDSIRTTYNCTILIVHHSGKDESKGGAW